MAKRKAKSETKVPRDLATVLNFLNGDFGPYALRYLSVKEAQAIQQALLESYDRGEIAGSLLDLANEYVTEVVWTHGRRADSNEPDLRKFGFLRDISKSGSAFVLSCISVVNDTRFWRLRRCVQCEKFFLPRGKQQTCSDKCLREREIRTAQERVEKARKKRRFDELFPKLLKLQQMKGHRLSEVLERVPGFDVKLLETILEGRKPLTELVSQIKYRNRRILQEAKL
jgi:hypothetical protein